MFDPEGGGMENRQAQLGDVSLDADIAFDFRGVKAGPYQAVPYLRENLAVPVINPGPLTCKLAELCIGLDLSHSRRAYPRPNVPNLEMLVGAAETEGQAPAAS